MARIPHHPGLVRVLDLGDAAAGNAFWIAMELADPEEAGGAAEAESYRPLTLASVAAAETALPLAKCISIGLRLASALEHLQRHHLLHRDVKPGNVLFVGGRPVIADAGLVVDVREAASIVGTPGYVPPENHGSPQGDVFSLGRTLWRIATGRSPEEAGSAPCAEADTSDPDFRDFLAIVERAMSVSPERRYRSAKALYKALSRLGRRRMARRVRRIALPVLGAVCAVLLLALAWALGRRSAALRIKDEFRRRAAAPKTDDSFRGDMDLLPNGGQAEEELWRGAAREEAMRRLRAEASPGHFAIFQASVIEEIPTEEVMALYDVSRDNLYQIRKRMRAAFERHYNAALRDMDAPLPPI